jgi:Flp pilus assembly pilin Flp
VGAGIFILIIKNNHVMKILKNNSGATQIEYAFICLLVIIAAMAGFLLLGESSTDVITGVESEVTPALKRGS